MSTYWEILTDLGHNHFIICLKNLQEKKKHLQKTKD